MSAAKNAVALAASALWLSACAAPHRPAPSPSNTPRAVSLTSGELVAVERPDLFDPVSLCDLQRELDQGAGTSRAVAITAAVAYDFEYGYSLADHNCRGSHGFPQAFLAIKGEDGQAFNPLDILWRGAGHEGQRAMCVCAGRLFFKGGGYEFQLVQVRKTWWEEVEAARRQSPSVR